MLLHSGFELLALASHVQKRVDKAGRYFWLATLF